MTVLSTIDHSGRARMLSSTALVTGVALLTGGAQASASAAVVTPSPVPDAGVDGRLRPVGSVVPNVGTGKVFITDQDDLDAVSACMGADDAQIDVTFDGETVTADPGTFDLDIEPADGQMLAQAYTNVLGEGLPQVLGLGTDASTVLGGLGLIWGPNELGANAEVALSCSAEGVTPFTVDFTYWGGVSNYQLPFGGAVNMEFWYGTPEFEDEDEDATPVDDVAEAPIPTAIPAGQGGPSRRPSGPVALLVAAAIALGSRAWTWRDASPRP